MDMSIASSGRDAAEELRTQELSRYRIAQDDADPRLRLLAQLAVSSTSADIGGVSLIYKTEALVVTADGVDPHQIERISSICAHAVESQAAFFEIPDLFSAPHPVGKPFPDIRHYAAATLLSRRGYVLGTLWVMTGVPGRLDEGKRLLLQGLAKLVVDALEMHYSDAITGMHNRAALIQQVQNLVSSSPAPEILVGYIDLAGFHQVNEIYGRETGDYILSEFAQRLLSWVAPDGIAGHFGSDRFGFVLLGPILESRLVKLRQAIDEPLHLAQGCIYTLSARIGVVREALPTLVCAGALFDMSETASSMIGTMHGFSVVREYGSILRERAQMLQALLKVLDGCAGAGELTVFYQPQVNFADGSLIGFEALARWSHPVMGNVSTQEFVTLAESSGYSFKLDMYIARLVCRILRRWRDAGLPAVPVSLNLSRASLVNPSLAESIRRLLDEHGLPGAQLEVEVTEGQLLEAPLALQKSVEALRSLGLRIAIDDFGIGYSNLDAIVSLQFDRLKVDRRFVHGVADSETTASLFQLIQGVARVSGVELLCEGLERQSDLDWLRHHEAYFAQGWYFSTAQPAQHAERLLRKVQEQMHSPALQFDLHKLFS